MLSVPSGILTLNSYVLLRRLSGKVFCKRKILAFSLSVKRDCRLECSFSRLFSWRDHFRCAGKSSVRQKAIRLGSRRRNFSCLLQQQRLACFFVIDPSVCPFTGIIGQKRGIWNFSSESALGMAEEVCFSVRGCG